MSETTAEEYQKFIDSGGHDPLQAIARPYEDLLIAIAKATDEHGLRIRLDPRALIPFIPAAVAAMKPPPIELPPEERVWRQRVETLARILCANSGLDPYAEIAFGPPRYLGPDVCYPIAFYVPHEDQRERLWTIFSRQAELVLAAIDKKTQSTPSKDTQ